MKISKRKLELAKKNGIVLDENNMSVINLTVDDADSFFSKIYLNKPVITSDVADIICLNKAAIRWKNGVRINIISDVLDDAEKCQSAVREYFLGKYIDNCKKHKAAYLVAILFSILGIETFSLLFVLSSFLSLGLWEEVINVIAWVFVWEACDLVVIQGMIDRHEHIVYRNLSTATVNIVKQSETTNKK